MATDLDKRIAELRTRADAFNSVMRELSQMGPALRSDKKAFAEWQQIMLDGGAIRAAIETSGKMIDGAAKWVSRTFQRDALDAIPFAADVVQATTNGSISAIDNFIDRARKTADKFRPAFQSFLKLDKKEQQRIGALPVPNRKTGTFPALLLVAVLGGLIYFAKRFDSEAEIFDYD